MNHRRQVQQQHERAVVSDFLGWFERRRKVAFCVVDEPNPPEAIIQSPRLTRWIEVVDAFWSKEWARDQYSYATPGEKHISIGSGPHPEPDLNFAHSLVESLSKKLVKSSYLAVAKKYGPGYLVVNVDYPMFDRRAHRKAEQLWAQGNRGLTMAVSGQSFSEFESFEAMPFKHGRCRRHDGNP
jgi:hypothetical protein